MDDSDHNHRYDGTARDDHQRGAPPAVVPHEAASLSTSTPSNMDQPLALQPAATATSLADQSSGIQLVDDDDDDVDDGSPPPIGMTEAGMAITKPSRQADQINVNNAPDLHSAVLVASLKNPNASNKQQHTAPPVDDASSP
jgi:hypothetical protein